MKKTDNTQTVQESEAMRNRGLEESPIQTICFLMPALGQPRWSKRIAMLESEGFHVKALAFDRDYHKGRMPNCEVHMLGVVAQGQYLKRLIVLAKAMPAIRQHTHQVSAIYAFGLDLAILALLARMFRKTLVFLEVGDIRPIQVSLGLKGKFMKYLSQKTYNFCDLMVVTAEEFVSGYYADGNPSTTPWLVLENKMDPTVKAKLPNQSIVNKEGACDNLSSTIKTSALSAQSNTHVSPNHKSKVIRIGYFGLLRSPWSFNSLAAYARDNKDSVKIHVAGALHDGHEQFRHLTKCSNVLYLGPYKSPDDLAGLYKQVDLVWGCYPEPPTKQTNHNEQWIWAQAVCRSNRFYESCFYKTPIMSMTDSGDGKVVEQWHLGPTLHSHEYSEIKKKLDAISPDDIKTWRKNMEKIPVSIYQYTTEPAELAATIHRLIKS